ncbi:MAG: hypothetical protein HY819_03365 [Acidobacteria bacterium]|nr:hypothetical protein [Acidobacteriota bacterium]
MSEVQKIIQNIALPIHLSDDVFLLLGKKRRIPDFDLMLRHLPEELRKHLDPNATASSGGIGTYLLPLIEGRLKIRVEGQEIVEITEVEY